MGNPDTLIPSRELGATPWSAPLPWERIEEQPSRIRRARSRRTTSDDVKPAGSSTATDAVWSATAGLVKGGVAFQVILFATVAVGQVWFGGPSMVITGQSMEPSIPAGSVVATSPATATGPMPGTIVSFDIDGNTVTHRVVERTGNQLTTRGDANAADDSTKIGVDDVIGSARLVVPYVGLPNMWLRAERWAWLGLWGAANLIGLAAIGYNSKRARRSHPAAPVRSARVRPRRRSATKPTTSWVALFPQNLGN